MTWNVVWADAALNELAKKWLAADSAEREAITRAVAALDQLLGKDPFQQSESRPAGERIIFAPPLAALYRVDEASNTVQVGHVWTFRTPH